MRTLDFDLAAEGRVKEGASFIVQAACKRTRPVRIGSIVIGGGRPVAVQSMTATRTRSVEATVSQVKLLEAAGADVVRIAADSVQDAEALAEIRAGTSANLAVDLQENYRLAERVAAHVDKIRYNPGHLHHQEPGKPWREKVRWLAAIASEHDCALRVGVNCGSVDPRKRERYAPADWLGPMLESVLEHCELLDEIGFYRYCVSLKDSDPARVVEANRRLAELRPEVPLHLGVTEAGIPPDGVMKTRRAFEPLLREGIGDTIRVSLAVPAARKAEEVEAGRRILADVAAGRFLSEAAGAPDALNIIACPSCSRVENETFVNLAVKVKEMTRYARRHAITIAVMGCRVNGPGETDDADLGLWCGPRDVKLKRRGRTLGAFPYDAILPRLKAELDLLIASRSEASEGGA